MPIERRHGTNGMQDHSMRHPEDLARIRFVLDNFDSVQSTGRITKADRNRDKTFARTVEISKKIDGTYYIIEAVPDTKNNRMTIISAYIEKNRNTVGADAEAPGGTSETNATPVPATESRDTGSSAEAARNRQENSVNDIVSQPDEVVKGDEISFSISDTSEAAGPIYSMPARARDDALRVENALASSLAKMFGVNARHTTDEYKALRTEVARPMFSVTSAFMYTPSNST